MQLIAPLPHAVIQRDRTSAAIIPVRGVADAPEGTPVRVCMLPAGRGAHHAGCVVTGRVGSRGSFEVHSDPLPAGGPYSVEVVVGDEIAKVADVLIGDLFILAGQSNMDGCGKFVDMEPPSKLVHCFYYDDRWDIAQDPLCRYNEAVDSVHWGVPQEDLERATQNDLDFRCQGAGLGIRFAKDIVKRHSVPVGLLACSHGGTSLEQWSPDKLDMGGASLYGSMIRRVRATGGKVAGCLWYQGESDAATEAGLQYRANMGAWVQALRRDLKLPRLPVIQVQLACWLGDAVGFPHWNRVQTDQIALEADLPAVSTVAAIDLPLDDAIHVSTQGLRRLGARMAHVASRLVYGDKQAEIGPRLKSAKVTKDRMTVELRFATVNGKLAPATAMQGFGIEAAGVPVAIPGRAVKDGSTVVLTLREPLPQGAVLWHGRGTNPVTNLRDSADLPVPVFGPVEL